MDTKITRSVAALIAGFVVITGTGLSEPAQADSAAYIGGSVGDATIEVDVPDAGNIDNVFEFDESDFAWKAFGGFDFDLTVLDLSIEGGYVDLGSPSGPVEDTEIGLDVTGWDVFGLVGIELGPIGVFGKAGVISWDADTTIDAIETGGDDGTDPAYGIGARFKFETLEIRGEYEYFDIDSAQDVYMLSAGAVWRF
jgi:outer membrane immunogenic protein